MGQFNWREDPEKAFERLQFDSKVMMLAKRRRIAQYLRILADELEHAEPHVSVRVEQANPPPLVCVTVTRQLYGDGHPQNDGNDRLELFDPFYRGDEDDRKN